ncbi:hypothetical protein D7Y27_06210 [Corallococcus sp. AB004]|uniref:hypothetical protein n=1 Tax=Corallococcus TaxID=83461 RepID=UPI000EA209E1|nr:MULTISPECIES: hypothetical protein [Corallococcus]NPC73066.1 hypothetical protein [Corallococcus exiguus]RKH98009.1 hypothetical protein D7Y04_23875 [Corallococcus sp. AB038B]RKI47586.1 hypothetical protein D7Y27_06210 [Corallococcus sp. AB004]
MQLRKMMVMLAALSSMSLALTACGDETTTVDSCTSDTDCSSGFCNTAAGVCMDTCESGSDCADSEKNCAVLAGSSNTQKVCQCQTNQLCNSGDTTDLVCGTVSKRCEEPGSTPEGCTKDADCGAGNTCNTTTGVCSPAATTCTGEGQATCAYGSACFGGTCSAPPAPTCSNLQGKPAASFDPATGTGNIIYSVTKEIFGTACGTDTSAQTVKARVSFYSKNADLPATKEGLNGFFYVRTTGGEQNGVPLSNGYQRSADARSASLSVNLCVDKDLSQTVLGFYFTNGNGFCATLTK